MTEELFRINSSRLVRFASGDKSLTGVSFSHRYLIFSRFASGVKSVTVVGRPNSSRLLRCRSGDRSLTEVPAKNTVSRSVRIASSDKSLTSVPFKSKYARRVSLASCRLDLGEPGALSGSGIRAWDRILAVMAYPRDEGRRQTFLGFLLAEELAKVERIRDAGGLGDEVARLAPRGASWRETERPR